MGKIRIKQIGADVEKTKKETPPMERPTSPQAPLKPQKKKQGKPKHPRQQHGRSARYKKALAKSKIKSLALKDAVKLAQKTATAKFPESIEAHVNVEKTGFRTTVLLPYSTGRKHSILILTANPKALKSDAFKEFESVALNIQLAGPEEIEAIKNAGSAPEVDEIWATSDIMKEITTIARILGPAGLMPNPKKGTIIGKETPGVLRSKSPGVKKRSGSPDVEYADAIKAKLKELSSGKITLETERKAPIIHAVLGKTSMDEDKLTANLEAILAALPPKQIKKITIASTMGPAIKVALPNN